MANDRDSKRERRKANAEFIEDKWIPNALQLFSTREGGKRCAVIWIGWRLRADHFFNEALGNVGKRIGYHRDTVRETLRVLVACGFLEHTKVSRGGKSQTSEYIVAKPTPEQSARISARRLRNRPAGRAQTDRPGRADAISKLTGRNSPKCPARQLQTDRPNRTGTKEPLKPCAETRAESALADDPEAIGAAIDEALGIDLDPDGGGP